MFDRDECEYSFFTLAGVTHVTVFLLFFCKPATQCTLRAVALRHLAGGASVLHHIGLTPPVTNSQSRTTDGHTHTCALVRATGPDDSPPSLNTTIDPPQRARIVLPMSRAAVLHLALPVRWSQCLKNVAHPPRPPPLNPISRYLTCHVSRSMQGLTCVHVGTVSCSSPHHPVYASRAADSVRPEHTLATMLQHRTHTLQGRSRIREVLRVCSS